MSTYVLLKLEIEVKLLIVCLYVDDLIFTGTDLVMFEEFKKSMMVEFEMSNLGMMHYFLGIEVMQPANGTFVSKKSMCEKFWTGFE